MSRRLRALESIEALIGKNYSSEKKMKGGVAGISRYQRTGKAEYVTVAVNWNTCGCIAERRGPPGLWNWKACAQHADIASER